MKYLTTFTVIIALILGTFFITTEEASAAITFAYETTLASTSDLTTYTFAGADIGTADTARCVIVSALSRKAGAAHTLSSMTIGGVSATIIQNQNNTVTNSDTAALAAAIVPTGATGDIVVTWSTGVLRTQIGIWTAINTDNCTTPSDSDASTAADPSVTLTIPAGGVAVGSGLSAAASSATWTGMTENFDTTLESFVTVTGASTSTPATGNLTVTIDFAASTETAGVFATWAPVSTPAAEEFPQLRINYGVLRVDNGKFIID